MFTLFVAPKASEDLVDIQNYIRYKLGNPIAAKNTVAKIVAVYKKLSYFPDRGNPVQKFVPFPTDYRFVRTKKYLIFYRIENDTVSIIRILYYKRDFIRILFENESEDR